MHPPPVQALNSACIEDKGLSEDLFPSFDEGGQRGLRYKHRDQVVELIYGTPERLSVDVVEAKRAEIAGLSDLLYNDLRLLDDMAWDVAALTLTAFFHRTSATSINEPFALLLRDYFDWRGTKASHRDYETKVAVWDRLRLLSSQRVRLAGPCELYTTDLVTGRRRKERFRAEGPFLVFHATLSRETDCSEQASLPFDDFGLTLGAKLTLGDWATKFIEARSMLGLNLKRLAEYDTRRQHWERRIGWYLLFQMQNQAPHSQIEAKMVSGVKRTIYTPQQPLYMKTILEGSRLTWRHTAEKNPRRIIRHFCDALATLKSDGILGDYRRLGGPSDLSDFCRNKDYIEHAVKTRWLFMPGKEQLDQIANDRYQITGSGWRESPDLRASNGRPPSPSLPHSGKLLPQR